MQRLAPGLMMKGYNLRSGKGWLAWATVHCQPFYVADKILTAGVEITAQGLAGAVGEYLDSERAKQAIHDCLETATTTEIIGSSAGATGGRRHRIRARTAPSLAK